ncbi:hypothetical protein ACFCZ3_11905 [Cellulosimicrobium cellulans]|uniref:hypothetical protein n=1 Tax=Cellulosimicrobium cellulans TaxID=1710 RepID=UPI0035E0E7D5
MQEAGNEFLLAKGQSFALLFEQESARQLLAHGVHTLRSTTYFSPVQDAVFTTLSIGVEKFLKIAIGLLRIAEGKPWPTKSVMRNDYGHGIVEMFPLVWEPLEKWADESGKDYVLGLLHGVSTDATLAGLFSALDAYGRSGRFYHLDTLAAAPQQIVRPEDTWSEAENKLVEADPELREMRARGHSGSPEDFELFLRALRARLADSIVDWWFALTRAGENGGLGSVGKQFGSGASPSLAIPPAR